MGALSDRRARKSLLFVAVAGAHALVIALLISESHILHIPTPESVPILAFLVPASPRRRARFAPPALGKPAMHAEPITAAPITLALQGIEAPIPVPPPINWVRAAREAVHAVLRRRKRISFGFPKAGRAFRQLPTVSGRPTLDHAYRLSTGQTVDRVTRNCYVESNPPPLGASQLVRQAQMSSVWCKGGAGSGPPKDNLFKNLPAYDQYQKMLKQGLRQHHRPVPHPQGH